LIWNELFIKHSRDFRILSWGHYDSEHAGLDVNRRDLYSVRNVCSTHGGTT
jgi:hypothetical protein